MEMLRHGVAQSLIKKKTLPDVPMMTLLRENMLDGIKSRYPATNVIVPAGQLKASLACCNVMDLSAWLNIIPPRYRGIKIAAMIEQEKNLLVYTGRFLLDDEIMQLPVHIEKKTDTPLTFHWLILPYVRDHRHLKDAEAFLCMLVNDSDQNKKITKCAFEIFARVPHFCKKICKQLALTWTYHGPASIKPVIRDYSVLWIAPGLEVMKKVPELFSFMEEQQQYLIGELEKKLRRLLVVRHQVLSLEPDHPPADVRNAAFEALKTFFQQFDEKEMRNPTPVLDAENNFDYMELSGTPRPKT